MERFSRFKPAAVQATPVRLDEAIPVAKPCWLFAPGDRRRPGRRRRRLGARGATMGDR